MKQHYWFGDTLFLISQWIWMKTYFFAITVSFYKTWINVLELCSLAGSEESYLILWLKKKRKSFIKLILYGRSVSPEYFEYLAQYISACLWANLFALSVWGLHWIWTLSPSRLRTSWYTKRPTLWSLVVQFEEDSGFGSSRNESSDLPSLSPARGFNSELRKDHSCWLLHHKVPL